ncbi:TetR/AcrR family transcriptional regulator [Spirillospora sp. CA-253888]
MQKQNVAAPPEGRRERNKRRVRESLYQAALELFAEQGYDSTSIDQIAERADVARGTFFNHFKHKEDLISEWSERRRLTLQELMEHPRLSSEGTAVRLRQCMQALADINERERRLTRVMIAAWVRVAGPLHDDPDGASVLADVLRAGIASGEVARDVDPELVARALRDAYLGALYRWCAADARPVALGDALQDILEVVLVGALRRP